MKKIETIKIEEGRKKRVAIYFAGQRRPLRLEVDTALKGKLTVGRELTEDELSDLAKLDMFYRTQNAALNFLSYRPRSESEVKARLTRRGFTAVEIDAVLVKLREQGLVDDTGFAGLWTENRREFSPRSRFLTRMELRRKGVANDVIEGAVENLDDSENAYRAGLARARRLSIADKNIFRKRLGDYLRRRGFDFSVVNDTVERVWREVGGASQEGA
jgi:regulatory protein